MRALSLFTGYGGIDLALKEYISETIGYCEIEKYCQGIIASRIADGLLEFAPIYPDVTRIKGNFGDCDIIFGGFPCQDISVAGNGKGLAGERSGLFYEIIRLTKEIRPSFVFLENVPAIRTRGLEQVIKEFTKIGYDCRWTCLSASSVGAPHKRERWFLLSHAKRNGGGSIARVSASAKNESKKLQQENWQAHSNDIEEIHSTLANSMREGLEGQPKSEVSRGERQEQASNDGLFSKQFWAVEPNVGRVANGVDFRMDRIKALGNGVVPAQVKKAFEVLIGVREAYE